MLRELSITVPEREVLRLLGYRRGRLPKPTIAARLAHLWPEGIALCRPKGAYTFVAGDEARRFGLMRSSSCVAVGVATIGEALEQRVAQHLAQGEELEALLLDAMGSAAADAAADAVHDQVCADASSRGLFATTRVSPGYGRWDLGHQAELLSYLPTAALGVRLSSSAMMVPRKSVSFAVRLRTVPGETTRRSRCAHCRLLDCGFRETPLGEAGEEA